MLPVTDPGNVQLTEFDAEVDEKPEPLYPLKPAYLPRANSSTRCLVPADTAFDEHRP